MLGAESQDAASFALNVAASISSAAHSKEQARGPKSLLIPNKRSLLDLKEIMKRGKI